MIYPLNCKLCMCKISAEKFLRFSTVSTTGLRNETSPSRAAANEMRVDGMSSSVELAYKQIFGLMLSKINLGSRVRCL